MERSHWTVADWAGATPVVPTATIVSTGAPGHAPAGPQLVKRVRALAHVDDRLHRVGYQAILKGGASSESPAQQRLAEMLFYSLFPYGGGFRSLRRLVSRYLRRSLSSARCARRSISLLTSRITAHLPRGAGPVSCRPTVGSTCELFA
jgi:hypothetical protein